MTDPVTGPVTDPVSDAGNPAKAVRDEDAFDVAAVAGWLREHAQAFREDLDGVPEVRQFPGGASNLTYLLRYPTRDLILRRPPTGASTRSLSTRPRTRSSGRS